MQICQFWSLLLVNVAYISYKCCFNIMKVTKDSKVATLEAELHAKDAEIQRLKEEPRVNVSESSVRRHSSTQVSQTHV